MSSTTKSRFFLGFLFGSVAGLAAGILLAPDKGEETRQLVADLFEEYKEKGKEIYETKMAEKKG